MRASRKREHYWNGFRDALMRGVRDPFESGDDSARVAYDRGFKDGWRTEQRLIKNASGASAPELLADFTRWLNTDEFGNVEPGNDRDDLTAKAEVFLSRRLSAGRFVSPSGAENGE